MSLGKRLREPQLHFLAIGAAMFLYFQAGGGGSTGPGSTRIVITPGQIAHLEAGFTRTWSRPPTAHEFKAVLDEWVREEIAVREAMGAGFDRDDTFIRRRLRQKLEFLVEDEAEAKAPTDDEPKAWVDAHAEQFRAEPRIALRQLFVSRDRRGAAAEADTASILTRLEAAGQSGLLDGAGFVGATGLLHAVGTSIGLIHRWAAGRILRRAAGLAVSLAGIFFLWRVIA